MTTRILPGTIPASVDADDIKAHARQASLDADRVLADRLGLARAARLELLHDRRRRTPRLPVTATRLLNDVACIADLITALPVCQCLECQITRSIRQRAGRD